MESKDRGALLEDLVASFFRNWGFNTFTRTTLTDDAGTSHEIDVYATKQETFGLITIAVECKNVSSPIGIEHIRNFITKLNRLKISKGIFVSTSGFTTGAEDLAHNVGIELWEEKDVIKKREKIKPANLLNDALHPKIIDPMKVAIPDNIENSEKFFKLKPKKTYLNYIPIHILEFDCYSQKSVRGETIDLSCGGSVAVDDRTGKVIDLKIESNNVDRLSLDFSIPVLDKILRDSPSTIEINLNVLVEKRRLSPRIAKRQAKRGLAELLYGSYKAPSGKTRIYRGVYYQHTTTKQFKPKQKDINILDQTQVYYPIWNISLDYKGKEFVRIIDAIEGEILKEPVLKCEKCGEPAFFLCSNCGVPLCLKHITRCETCGKVICEKSGCKITKGKIFKKNYCVSCA